MDIQKLKYFYTIANVGNVTKSAEIIHISQPSLTQAIHNLEKELDIPLFYHNGKKLILSDYGVFLKEKLDSLLPEFDNLSVQLENFKNFSKTNVKLNVLAASSFVIDSIMSYKKKNPEVNFDFEQNVLKSDCDIIITTNTLNPSSIHNYKKRCVKKEEIYLAVPKNSKYAMLESIELSQVSKEGFIMLSSTRLFGTICKKFCTISGFEPKILFESDSPTAVQNMISMGSGIAFWPEYSWGKVANKNVVLIPISFPICQRDLIIELHERAPQSKYAEDLYNFLIKKI